MPIEWLPDALDRLTGDVEPVLRLRHGSRDAWILAARQMTAAEAQAHKAWGGDP